ncbi:hypothetical protein BS47DRAFT_264345 [Hydnum rufescens UP504]|uniref:Carboxylic ester hydrolase n=1 Tax=Hydnum rufescens UP504 TaxID=1448309 RepID=A0A9P6ALB0_9AGAM|nr:hypothetical protein BS47DRAFT_264345 [Hydnum rufescens UP504]
MIPSRIISAKAYGLSCIQTTSRVGSYRVQGHVSEDCLTVNVIRPASTDSSAKLPVMVWIYGGGFTSGASVRYDGSELVKQSLVIIIYVSMNYRLNLFGFLASSEVEKRAKSKGDAVLNAGLLDQRLALQWVQKNIDAFGGDRDKVVVFGESAGAMSIGSHLLSNHGKHSGLFRGAILESGGSIGIPVIRAKEYDASYAKLAERVACNSSSSSSVFDCLRTVPVDTFQAVLEERRSGVTAAALREHPNNVVQDDDFHHARPSEAFKAGKIARVPTIIGTVLDEGVGFGTNKLTSETNFENS